MAAPMRMRWAVMSFTRTRGLRAQHGLDGLARRADDAVDLRLGHDERRGEVDRVARGRVRPDHRARPRHDAPLHHLSLDARRHLAVWGEVLLGRAVLDQLDGREEPLAAADVARVWVVAERCLEPGEETLAHLRRVLPEALARHDLEVLHRDRAARRVARVG